jgi:hypothetical protein
MNKDGLNEATLYLLEIFDMMNKREEERERATNKSK